MGCLSECLLPPSTTGMLFERKGGITDNFWCLLLAPSTTGMRSSWIAFSTLSGFVTIFTGFFVTILTADSIPIASFTSLGILRLLTPLSASALYFDQADCDKRVSIANNSSNGSCLYKVL